MSQYYYFRFSDSLGKITSTDTGYTVTATQNIMPGDIIEECLVQKTNTPLNTFFGDDQAIYVELLKHTVIDNISELPNITLVSGNYMNYARSSDHNAIYQYDDRFGIVTIRAVKQINRSDEIKLPAIQLGEPEPMKLKKKGGCGCNKNKNKGRKILPAPSEREQTQKNVEFKSMVDGKNLESIRVNSENDYIR